ncbi:MAG: hypothetical protein QNJ84_12470 [Alphaproteobacteria bacterium]|nr:hypothetical protein [Alphaproteobacteria bacterium]
MRPLVSVLAAAFLLAAFPAHAEIRVTFAEGAPKDRFTVTNAGACALGPAVVSIDLDGSAGGLIFDTTPGGAGLSVFQPFELVAGAERIASVSPVSDGGKRIDLSFRTLLPNESAAFTIDVDDTLRDGPMGQTMVAGSEIEGASVTVRFGAEVGTSATSSFTADSTARLAISTCLS